MDLAGKILAVIEEHYMLENKSVDTQEAALALGEARLKIMSLFVLQNVDEAMKTLPLKDFAKNIAEEILDTSIESFEKNNKNQSQTLTEGELNGSK